MKNVLDIKPTKGGRPKSDPSFIRSKTIGVRVSFQEYTQLSERAARMGYSPSKWLREAALSRRLPPPPVPTINCEQYVKLARLAANLNQLAHAANEGKQVIVSSALLNQIADEVKKLRLGLLGAGSPDD